jgi:predicted RNA binding protein YcfA (HicA-like mRNA interferase family)
MFMPKLPALRPQKVIRALNRAGFVLNRIKGSHHHFDHPEKPECVVTVPVHGRDIKRGTLQSIIKQAGMTVDECLDLL